MCWVAGWNGTFLLRLVERGSHRSVVIPEGQQQAAASVSVILNPIVNRHGLIVKDKHKVFVWLPAISKLNEKGRLGLTKSQRSVSE